MLECEAFDDERLTEVPVPDFEGLRRGGGGGIGANFVSIPLDAGNGASEGASTAGAVLCEIGLALRVGGGGGIEADFEFDSAGFAGTEEASTVDLAADGLLSSAWPVV